MCVSVCARAHAHTHAHTCLQSEVQLRSHRWHIRKKKYSKMSKIYSHSFIEDLHYEFVKTKNIYKLYLKIIHFFIESKIYKVILNM